MTGGASWDYFSGGAGNDIIRGLTGNDGLVRREGNDQLFGGEGNDLLSGGAGDDLLAGEAGADTFEFYSWENTGTDTITDLESGVDTLVFYYDISFTSEQVDIGGDGEMDLRLTLSSGGTINLLGVTVLGPNDVQYSTVPYF
ncbi:MAG TPA: hypothetical protein VHG30_03625 [Microvirga sp.]|nr:hypothetical protein [Microvirga sp.]